MDLSVSDAPVGRLLDGRYRVESLLARGGMATVYQATDTRLDRAVALKVMHAELAADDEFVARFISEARSAARLSDPHIVGVYDQGEDEGVVFLAMEYIQGGTLRALLREQGRVEPDLALEIIEPVLAALRAAHQAEIVHRDVKPENVLISDDGRVKVADFGLARPVRGPSNATTRGLLLGTVNYISPEQALGERATPRSDVYAAGIMLFEMLTGRPPHSGPTDFVVVRAHIDEPVPPPSEWVPVPSVVDDLVLTATAREPDARYPDAGSFLAAARLARASLASGDSEPGSGRHASPPPPPGSGSLSAPAGPEVSSDPGSDAFDVANTFHHDSDRVAGANDDADSGAIELANAFYHETPPTRPAPTPPPHQASNTRVISTSPDEPAARPAGQAGAARMSEADEEESSRAQRRAYAQARRRRWRGPILFLIVLLVAAAVTVGAWWFGAGRWTSTPPLLDLAPEQAIASAEEAGLDAVVDGEEYSEGVEAGLVLRTEPGPGEEILRGGTISLVLSQGPERYEVPDVLGMTREQVETALSERNLVPQFTEEYSADVDEGRTISQNVTAGENVRPDTEVTVVMSLGPEPAEIANYTNRPVDEARQQLRDAGFEVNTTEEFSEDVPPGVVISQDPDSGTGHVGDEISLVVSKGPEIVDVQVPEVRGQQVKDAQRILEKAGFKVKVEQTFPGNPRDRRVMAQDPPGGSKAPEKSTVTLRVL